MKSLTPQNEVRQFIGVVNYYLNMWERLSRALVPLTNMTFSKEKIGWTKIKQDAFDKIKQIVARDTLLAYLYFNE